ncbi:MAG: hypothetical protein KKF12_12265 [Proteobacteria bacterium]|nr:hypothetical protein [Desulfobacula sp.]MBU3951019.1 hypothetical protein [Pseudomonadota bacterium]MBU4131587.1 hypothetical protein [Pseudomonadota bacterium]
MNEFEISEEIKNLNARISKQNEQISAQNKVIADCQQLFISQQEIVRSLILKTSANTTISNIFFPILINTNPGLKAMFEKMITDVLSAENKSIEANLFLKSRFTEILNYIQNPPKRPSHLKVVKTDNQETTLKE